MEFSIQKIRFFFFFSFAFAGELCTGFSASFWGPWDLWARGIACGTVGVEGPCWRFHFLGEMSVPRPQGAVSNDRGAGRHYNNCKREKQTGCSAAM